MIAKFLLEKPLTAKILAFALLVLSLIAWKLIPVELVPSEGMTSYLFIRVNAAERSSPEILEVTLTRQVEGLAKGLSQVQEFSSTTDSGGVTASIQFGPGIDLESTSQMLAQQLSEIATDFTISRSNPDASPVLRAAVTFDEGKNTLTLKNEIKTRLESIEGVSKIEWSGMDPMQYDFGIPVNRIMASGLDPSRLMMGLQLVSSVKNTGKIENDGKVLDVVVSENSKSLDHLRTINLGNGVTIDTIANEKTYVRHRDEVLQLNGSDARFVDIYAKDGANLFDLKRQFKGYKIQGANFEIVTDRISELESTLDDVFASLYQAIAITLFIVFIFMPNWRTTLVISVSIPLTVLLTVLSIFGIGQTLNVLTLSGLILSIGMVIDNAILVIERAKEVGLQRAAQDVFAPLIVATITNALIFVPVLFVDGDDDFLRLLKAFTVPIVISLVVSLLVAVLYVPILGSALKVKFAPSTRDRFKDSTLPLFFNILARWKTYLAGAIAASMIAFHFAADIELANLGFPEDPFLSLNVRFESTIASPQRFETFKELNSALIKKRDALNFKHALAEFNPNSLEGQIMVFPPDGSDSDISKKNLGERLKLWLADWSRPGVDISLGDATISGTKTKTARRVTLAGRSRVEILNAISDTISKLKANMGVEEVYINRSEYTRPDIQLAYSAQTSLSSLKAAVDQLRTLLGKVTLDSLATKGEPVNARVQILGADSKPMSLNTLLDAPITIDRSQVFAKSLFIPSESWSDSSIARRNGESITQVKVAFSKNATSSDMQQVDSLLDKKNLPATIWEPTPVGQKESEQQQANLFFIVGLSIFLIYVFLASQFESTLKPFVILLVVPGAILFGVFGLAVLSYELDVMARLSLVLLVGTAVNNAIILFDMIGQLRAEGLSRKMAIANGCASRIRSLAMTASIQVISLVPILFGNAKLLGVPYKSLAYVMVFGTLASTLLTLIILPIGYLLADSTDGN